MKHLLFKVLIINACLPMVFSHASNFVAAETQSTVSASDVSRKLEDTVLETDGFLKRFTPVGVEMKKKIVEGNTFDYIVVKKFLGFAKEVAVKGSLTFERVATGCHANEEAYLGTIDFTGSQPVVVDNVEEATLLVCSKESSKSAATVRMQGKIVYKGKKFSWIVEKFAIGLIKDQIEGLVSAIKQDVSAKR